MSNKQKFHKGDSVTIHWLGGTRSSATILRRVPLYGALKQSYEVCVFERFVQFGQQQMRIKIPRTEINEDMLIHS